MGIRLEHKQKQGEKYLLAIGIDKYNSAGYPELKYPVNDARKLRQLLIDEYGFELKNVHTLFDEECTADGVREKIGDLIDSINEQEDELIVFFAGHGAISRGLGFWIPHDSKERIELNLSVSAILDQLIGCCKQVLLLVDCCFSGTVTERAYPKAVFAGTEKSGSRLMVITSGSKHETVPDKSIFMETLLSLLATKDVSSFNGLVGDLTDRLTKCMGTTLTGFAPPDQLGMPFILQRRDKVGFELKKAFYDLNYTEQKSYLSPGRLFNLVYLRGTKDCGHHLFTHRYFTHHTQINVFNYRPKVISFGHDAQSADYSIWNKLAIDLGIKEAEASNVLYKIIEELQVQDWVLIIKVDGNCDNTALKSDLLKFCQDVNEYLARKVHHHPPYKMHCLVWDRREGIEGAIDITEWAHLNSQFTKMMDLPTIRPLDLTKDVKEWYYDVLANNNLLSSDDLFPKIKVEAVQKPFTIANVICQIAGQCMRMEVYDALFIKNNLLM